MVERDDGPSENRARIECSSLDDGTPTTDLFETYQRTPRRTRQKWRRELCRNCVRSPRNRRQPSTFTGSYRDTFCGAKSLNRLREEVFSYQSVSVAGIAFQACSFCHAAGAGRKGHTHNAHSRCNAGPSRLTFDRSWSAAYPISRAYGRIGGRVRYRAALTRCRPCRGRRRV